MIELIFVIVVLGILATLALPKFLSVSEQANVEVCESYVGTLNRTTGQTVWSKSIVDGNNGLVATYLDTYAKISNYITPPKQCKTTNLTTDSTFIIGANTYLIHFTEGTQRSSPTWSWTKQ
jgi:type II secretory pathway pseudopilin PulG